METTVFKNGELVLEKRPTKHRGIIYIEPLREGQAMPPKTRSVTVKHHSKSVCRSVKLRVAKRRNVRR